MQVSFQRIGKRGMTMIEVSEVWAVNRRAGKNASGNRRKHVAGITDWVGVGLVHRNDLVAAAGMREDTKRATNLIREFSDWVEFRVALDLDAHQD
jgi:hypothetical protein